MSLLCILLTCSIWFSTFITVPSAPQSNDDDYDLIIPRLILFAVIPFVIVLVLMVVIPVATVWVWRFCKLRRMKDRLTLAEAVRTGDDALEQGRLTRGTFHNTHADTAFSVPNQTLPQSQQTSHAPPRSQTSPYAPRSPAPRSPAPPPPTTHQQQQPLPPPQPPSPLEVQVNALQRTSEVVVDLEIPSNMPQAHAIGDRASIISGGFDVLAAVTVAEAKKTKRRSRVGSATSMKRTNSSAFRQWERPTTPPPPPPPPPLPPPTNGVHSPIRHLMGQQPYAVDYGDEDLPDEPLYEPIPGAQLDDYEVMTAQEVTTPDGFIDDDTYVIDSIDQSAPTNTQCDTYDVPRSYSNSPSYEVSASNSVPPPRPPKPSEFQNPLDKLVQEDPVNQTADFDEGSQVDDTYEALDLHDSD